MLAMMHPFAAPSMHPFAAPSMLEAMMSESLYHRQQHHVRELDDSYELTLQAPGVSADSVEVTLEDQTIKVVGENKRMRHAVEASFRLPRDADPATIQASTADGIITIMIGKRAPLEPTTITVSTEPASETDANGYTLNVMAAGISAADLLIQTRDGLIKIEGKTARTGALVDKVYNVPSDGDAEKATAAHVDGILTLSIPRKPANMQKIAVNAPAVVDSDVAAQLAEGMDDA